MSAIASTSTPQSMLRTDLDNHTNNNVTPPLSPQQQQRRIMLPPIRTLLNEQLRDHSAPPPPNSASSTSSRMRKLHTGSCSPLDENPLPSPVSSLHHIRKPIIPSHSSQSPLMDMHDCILNKQQRRSSHRRLPYSSSSSSSSPYRRRPSLSSSGTPSPTTTSTEFTASWVSHTSQSIQSQTSPLVSPISSTSSSGNNNWNFHFPGPLDTRRHTQRARQDTNETIKESRTTSSDCTPVYKTTSSRTPPPMPMPQMIQKKASHSKRLWELPLLH